MLMSLSFPRCIILIVPLRKMAGSLEIKTRFICIYLGKATNYKVLRSLLSFTKFHLNVAW